MARAVEQLDAASGKSRGLGGLVSAFGQETRRARMRGIGFTDHRTARGDGGGKVAARNTIEGERKIIRPKYPDWANRLVAGTNLQLGVDGCQTPAAGPRAACRGAQLPRCAGQFDVGQTRRAGQCRFGVGHFDKRLAIALEEIGILFEKVSQDVTRERTESLGGRRGGIQRGIDIGPSADGVLFS
jgi:hypothetical protein